MIRNGWIPVDLTAQERRLARQVGASRRGAKEAAGVKDAEWQRKIGFDKVVEGQTMGFAAEMALAKLLGLEADTTISKSGNRGAHLSYPREDKPALIFNAMWASDPTYDMRYLPDKIPQAHIFMMVTAEDLESTFWIVGGISRKRFREEFRRVDYGYGTRLAVAQSQLQPASRLVNLLELNERERRLREQYTQNRVHEQKSMGYLFDDDIADHIDNG